jgi:hypothetical protein
MGLRALPGWARLRHCVLRSRCGARAGGRHPRGHDCGDPLGKGRPKAAVYLLPCGPGRAPTGGFRRDSCRAKTAGRPGRPPAGLIQSKPSPALPAPRVAPADSSPRRGVMWKGHRWRSGWAKRRAVSPHGSATHRAVSLYACRGLRLAVSCLLIALRFSLLPVVAFPWPITLGCAVAGVCRTRKAQRQWSAGGRESRVARDLPRRGVVRVAGAARIARKHGHLSDRERCARPHAPQASEEPAGLTLGAGSVGEARNRKKPAGGRPWMAGRFRATGVASKTSDWAPTRPEGQ